MYTLEKVQKMAKLNLALLLEAGTPALNGSQN